jgi:hypothetical protein
MWPGFLGAAASTSRPIDAICLAREIDSGKQCTAMRASAPKLKDGLGHAGSADLSKESPNMSGNRVFAQIEALGNGFAAEQSAV